MRLARVVAVLAVLVPAANVMAEDAATITRLQGRALAAGTPLAQGSRVADDATITTGPGSRVEVRFDDDTLVVLGENATLKVESFRYAPQSAQGEARLRVEQGAFLVTTGAVAKLPGRPLSVATPVASIGVRGTKFWGGSLDNPLDVLLLDGAITVKTPGGSADLNNPLEGTDVKSPGAAPSPVGTWKAPRVARAMNSVSFQ
ncbi:MAG: FecR domain-containing protein [Magnetospirillum sp.]